MARYKYEIEGNIVKCISSYAGKPVIGIAKCDPKDEFSKEDGKALAKARCDLKVTNKRCKRANEKELEARAYMINAQKLYMKTLEYLKDSVEEREVANAELLKLSKTLGKASE